MSRYMHKTARRYRSTKPQQLPAKYEPGFASRLDQRTELAKQVRERFARIVDDLGGHENLSELKGMLVERVVWLDGVLADIEAKLGTADDAKTIAEALSRWIQGCNALTGLASKLGLERQLRNMSIKEYVKQTTNGNGEHDEHH